MRILNLTQHAATQDQVASGVVEPADKHLVQALITFDALPDAMELRAKATALAQMAAYDRFDTVMIGGAPFFMAPLEKALRERNIKVLYAFSQRESVDEMQKDGSVRKTHVFRHAGFVEVPSGDSIARSFQLANGRELIEEKRDETDQRSGAQASVRYGSLARRQQIPIAHCARPEEVHPQGPRYLDALYRGFHSIHDGRVLIEKES